MLKFCKGYSIDGFQITERKTLVLCTNDTNRECVSSSVNSSKPDSSVRFQYKIIIPVGTVGKQLYSFSVELQKDVGPVYLVYLGDGIFRFALHFSIAIKGFVGLCGWPRAQPFSFLNKGLKLTRTEKEKIFQRDLQVIVKPYF